MSPDEVNGILEKTLEITRSMLSFAKEENWVELAKLEATRQDLLQNKLNSDSVDKTEEMAAKINELLEVDKEMQSLVVKARDETRDEIIQLNKDKGAIKAYESK